MDEDELDFDFEQGLQPQQAAAAAAHAGPGGLVRFLCALHANFFAFCVLYSAVPVGALDLLRQGTGVATWHWLQRPPRTNI